MPENLPDKKATIVVLSLFQETWKYIHTSVVYRYRKSISIIELLVSIISIYIGFLATNF